MKEILKWIILGRDRKRRVMLLIVPDVMKNVFLISFAVFKGKILKD